MGRLTLAAILGKPQFPGCHKMSFADVISLPPLSLSKNISESDQLTAERMQRGWIEKMQSKSIAPNLVWPTSVFCPPAPANGWANVRFKIDIGRFPATCSRPLPLQPLSTASLMCWGCLGIILTLPTFGSYSDTSLHVVKPGQWSLSWTLLSTKCTLCLKILQLGDLSEAISSNESTHSSKSSSKNHLAEFPSSSFGSCFSCLAVLSHNFSVKTDTNTERERNTNTE